MENKVAVVTGGARGIGLAISMQLAREGCALAVLGTSSEEKAMNNMKPILDEGARVLYVQGSLGNAKDRQRFLNAILNRYGRIDVLVNNAGVAPKQRMDLLETTEDSFDFVMDINLKGTFS